MSSVSAVIPLHNKESSVLQAVESVFQQTSPPASVVVVDDGSTDGSVSRLLASPYAAQVRLIRQPQQGPGPARNTGWKECSTEWVAFLDADDLWSPTHLATLQDVAQEFPSAEWASTAQVIDWDSDPRLPSNLSDLWGSPVRRNVEKCLIESYFNLAASRQSLPHSSSTMVRRGALEAIGGFPAVIPNEDLAAWCALALRGDVAYSSARTVTIRKDGANLTLGLRTAAASVTQRDAMAIGTRPHYRVVEAALGGGKLPEHVVIDAERYLDSLLTRHWITVIVEQSQNCARKALPLLRRRTGLGFLAFTLAAYAPTWLARPLSGVSRIALRLLRLEKPVSPFIDRGQTGEGFSAWLRRLQ